MNRRATQGGKRTPGIFHTISAATLAAFLGSVALWFGWALQANLSSDALSLASLFYAVIFGTFTGFWMALAMALVLIAAVQRSGKRPGHAVFWLAAGGMIGVLPMLAQREAFNFMALPPLVLAGVVGAGTILVRLERN